MLLAILAFLAIVAFILIAMAVRADSTLKKRLEPFMGIPIAHRGFFDNKTNAPENSMRAFELAVEEGYGIELDVQLSKDGELVVFHDATLDRATEETGLLSSFSFDQLQSFTLFESDETIPLFRDVLRMVNGRAPLVIEVKPEGDWRGACETLIKYLDEYEGVYCVESFHPLAMRWFKKNRPNVARGQLSTNYYKDNIETSWILKLLLSNLLFNFLSKPHFVAYNYRYFNQFGYWLCRKLSNPVNVAWTIQTQQTLDENLERFDVFIFDSFAPVWEVPRKVISQE